MARWSGRTGWGAVLAMVAEVATACGASPALVTRSGVAVFWDGAAHPDAGQVEALVDEVHDAATRACPPEHVEDLERAWRSAALHWRTDGFDCGGRPVHGCQPSPPEPDVDVAVLEVIPDELGHVVWEQCFGRSGEETTPVGDGGWRTSYDSDFQEWLQATRAGP